MTDPTATTAHRTLGLPPLAAPDRGRRGGPTWPMLLLGGTVTVLRAGMAVPDWPTTFGINMFLYNMFETHLGRLRRARPPPLRLGRSAWPASAWPAGSRSTASARRLARPDRGGPAGRRHRRRRPGRGFLRPAGRQRARPSAAIGTGGLAPGGLLRPRPPRPPARPRLARPGGRGRPGGARRHPRDAKLGRPRLRPRLHGPGVLRLDGRARRRDRPPLDRVRPATSRPLPAPLALGPDRRLDLRPDRRRGLHSATSSPPTPCSSTPSSPSPSSPTRRCWP